MELAVIALFLTAGIASLFMSWVIGAGSSGATPFAPAVGANAISTMRAALVVGVFGLAGALTQGASVSEAVGRGLVGGVSLPAAGVIVALFVGAGLMAVGIYTGYPIATAFTVTGAVIGVGLALGGTPVWAKYQQIGTVWFLMPVFGGGVAYVVARGLIGDLLPERALTAGLAGLVGVTGTADVLTPMGGIALGLLAGAQLPIVFSFVEKRLKIDDVCAVFPVHGSAGVLGIVLFPLWSTGGSPIGGGVVPGGILSVEASMFAPQILGTLIITAWTVVATAAVWGAFEAVGQARVEPDHERDGLDVSEHGVDTYPEFGGRDTIATDGGHASTTDGIVRTDGGTPNDGEIKMVMGFIRPDTLSDVKQGLAEIGAPSLTVTNVSGRGSQPAKTGQWRGEEYSVDLHQKVKIECVVADIPAEDVAEAITEAGKTGEPGDGKVFILPVEEAYQIRTGEVGTDAV